MYCSGTKMRCYCMSELVTVQMIHIKSIYDINIICCCTEQSCLKTFFCLLARLLLSTLITDIADISRYMQYWYQYKQRLIIMEESSSSCILYCGTNPPKSKGIFSVRKFLTVLTVWKVNCLRSKHLWFNLVICSTPNKAIHNNEIQIYVEKNQTLQI